jgi:hypothetical protein
MDIQQNINFGLIETFEREHIEFAYPTQRQVTAVPADSATTSSVTA